MNDIGRKTGLLAPVVGREVVRSLVTDVGLSDPEDSSIDCLLAALRTTRELRDEHKDAEIVVIPGTNDSVVGIDRVVARRPDDLAKQFDIGSAVAIIGNAEDERLVPIIENRFRVDTVGRVIVRRAYDIGSTYCLSG